MTYSLLRTTAVSITALSLSACMSGQGSPWSPEFGQVQAPQYQQSTYGQSQYQFGQYPMPNVQQYNAHQQMPQASMQKYTSGSSQHLSPLPNAYAPQSMPRKHTTQTPTWTGQQSYNAPYSPPAQSTNYQQQMMDYTTQTYESAPQKSYQMPYTSNMNAPTAYSGQQHTSYGHTTYGHTARAPMTSQPTPSHSMTSPSMASKTMAPKQSTYGQQMAAPMTQSPSPYARPMSYAKPMSPPVRQTSMAQAPMAPSMRPAQMPGMQTQMPQSNTIPWGQAMAWMYQGQVASAEQSPNAEIKLTLLDGRTIMTQSPQLDDVKRLINDCGVMCQNMQVSPK